MSYNNSVIAKPTRFSSNSRSGSINDNSFVHNPPLVSHRRQFDYDDVRASHSIVDGRVVVKIDTGINDVIAEDNLPPDVIRIAVTTGVERRKSFKCPNCKSNFATETALNVHKKDCSRSKLSTWQCQYCLMNLISKVRLTEHMKSCPQRTKSGGKSKSYSRKPSTTQTVEVQIDSDNDEQEKNIVYDDDDDIDVDLAGEVDDIESHLGKVSQKHLGPVLTGGKFKCRDCERTFTKDAQYKRHIGACTNAPLNAVRIDDHDKVAVDPPLKTGRGKARKQPLGKRVTGKEKSIIRKDLALNHRTSFSTAKSSSKLPRTSSNINNKSNLVIENWDEMYDTPKKSGLGNSSGSNRIIMDMLDENIGQGGNGKDLSDSFLNCLDDSPSQGFSKNNSPVKGPVTLCGLCVRHMDTESQLVAHITTVHAKDVVNMHAILRNNTDLKTHKCCYCEQHFVSQEALFDHTAAIHFENIQQTHKNMRMASMELPCPWCHAKSVSKDLFQQHLASEHSVEFPETSLQPEMKPDHLNKVSLRDNLKLKTYDRDTLTGEIDFKFWYNLYLYLRL